MSNLFWLIAGVDLTLGFQALPKHDWFHLLSGIVFLFIGAVI